ncbi:MAG: WYL domain-containing protein [Clostridia bacterium]|nr:WYL domain-containing protein [Clostridia bacterium]
MAKSEKQKQKLFRILEILMRETDEENGISMNGIISRLDEYGIRAERKSIYDDFLTLEEMGYPVLKIQGKPPTYTLESRVFDLPELKMLVDAVQVSKFITGKKSREIIAKLQRFAGRKSYELSRQVYVEDKARTENNVTLYTIDEIHRAINEGKRLTFKYFDYNSKKEVVFRHGGKRYDTTPLTLMWNDENYYLVAYDEEENIVKNFRVDKIKEARMSANTRSQSEKVQSFNPSDYSKKIFAMYGGREELVTIEFADSLAGVVIDRFGSDHTFIKTDFGFKVSLRVMVSPTFFAWILGFGDKVRILSPDGVCDELLATLKKTIALYDK